MAPNDNTAQKVNLYTSLAVGFLGILGTALKAGAPETHGAFKAGDILLNIASSFAAASQPRQG